MVLVLFDTPAGNAIFKIKDEGKLEEVGDIYSHFVSAESASKMVSLKAFNQFEDTKQAVAAATALVESKLDKGLKKFLKKSIVEKKLKGKLMVADAKLGSIIKAKLGIKCVNNDKVMEVMRGIRANMTSLISGLDAQDFSAMALGLSHSLSRYKLKFSPDKVDTMIVQAIGLLDDLDKEINTYAMRVKEWYGWHFPEMQKVVLDNMQYAQVIIKMGFRTDCQGTDFSDILEDEVEVALKNAARISMGTEITDGDLKNIKILTEQVLSLSEYRTQLFDYLKSRMNSIAPNLTVMLGELVGARLIAHAGSLMNLAKQPASTIQILGAEKALFRALKTKSDTPKYGLIYHASLIGQAAPKNKGKISRVLAAKSALAIRVDALGESSEVTIGYEMRAKVEARLRQLEGGQPLAVSNGGAARGKTDKYDSSAAKASAVTYNTSADSTLSGKRKRDEESDDDDSDDGSDAETPKKKKKKKKAKKSDKKEKKTKKKKKKKKGGDDDDEEPKKKKKKKKKA